MTDIRAAVGIRPPSIHESMESKWDGELEAGFIITADRDLGLPARAIEAIRDDFALAGGIRLSHSEAQELAEGYVASNTLTASQANRIIRWAIDAGLVEWSSAEQSAAEQQQPKGAGLASAPSQRRNFGHRL